MFEDSARSLLKYTSGPRNSERATTRKIFFIDLSFKGVSSVHLTMPPKGGVFRGLALFFLTNKIVAEQNDNT